MLGNFSSGILVFIIFSIKAKFFNSFGLTRLIASHFFHALPVLQILCVYVSGLSGKE